ncbi:MAG: SH3 domain-containing protein [Anaerolineales bacterium]|nr:SH3 domain-containing protein [Anaerolineales bacterium]
MGLIFLGLGSLTFLDGSDEVTVEETPLPIEATTEVVEPLETSTPTVESEVLVTPSATSTTAVDLATTEPEAPPTVETGSPTPTAVEPVVVEQPSNQQTAVVNSPVVGLYLRVAPSGEILERLEDQAIVTLLGETQNVDSIEWVKVASLNGNEGWVAADYLLIESTP